jgi:hypothetical protein
MTMVSTYVFFLRTLLYMASTAQVSPIKKGKAFYDVTDDEEGATTLYLLPSMESYWKMGELVVLSGPADHMDKKIRWHQNPANFRQATTVPIIGYMMNDTRTSITGVVYPRVTYFGKTRLPLYPFRDGPIFLTCGSEWGHGFYGEVGSIVEIVYEPNMQDDTFQFHSLEPVQSEWKPTDLRGAVWKTGCVSLAEMVIQYDVWKAGLPVPKVLGVLSGQSAGGFCGFVMEKVNGMTLYDWLQHYQTLKDLIGIRCKVLDAIQLFNDSGFKHGDFHCGNIMIDGNGTVTIIDMGYTNTTKHARKIRGLSDKETFCESWDSTIKCHADLTLSF